MSFDKQNIPQPDIEQWRSDDWPNIAGGVRPGMAGVDITITFPGGFVAVSRDNVRGVVAALQSIADDLDTLDGGEV